MQVTCVFPRKCRAIIQAMLGSTLISNKLGNIHAEFRSPTMNFVDDIEFYFDEEAGLIPFCSAHKLLSSTRIKV